MADIFNLTDTWNAGATVFNAIKMNVTDTASDAASLLMDLQVGGSSMFSVSKGGLGIFATSIQAGNGSSIRWNGRSRMTAPSDGVIRLTNTAENDFGRLQFGGTTSSFPALKRSSAVLEVRLADDSAYGDLRSNTHRVEAAGSISWNARARLASSADGIIELLNNASSDFTRLNFGGSTSSFPALRRNGTTLDALLADASAFTDFGIRGLNMATSTAIVAGGSATTRIRMTSNSNFGIWCGSGVPTISAGQGSLYLRSDGSSGTTRAYINTDGGTTWTAINTVA